MSDLHGILYFESLLQYTLSELIAIFTLIYCSTVLETPTFKYSETSHNGHSEEQPTSI